MRRYDLAIFDFDGTLADTLPWFTGIINELAARHRFRRVDQADIDVLRTLGAREILKRLEIPAWRMPLIARDLRKLAARDRSQVKLFPGVEDMLARLHAAGVTLAIVSSNSSDNIRALLGDAAQYVRDWQCGAPMFGKKRLLVRVLRATGIASERTITIGDELRDLEAARAAGIHFGAVGYGYTTASALAAYKPDLELATVAEIADKLVQ